MARLSAENFRKSTDRKSSNPFARMFSKSSSRQSMAEKDAEADAASRTSTTSSPQTHRQLKEGFTKVGVWPSNRLSSASDVSAPVTKQDMSVMQEQDPKEVLAPQSLDTSLTAAAAKNRRTDEEVKNHTSGPALPVRRKSLADGDSDVTAIYVGSKGRQKQKNGNTSTPTDPAENAPQDQTISRSHRLFRTPSTNGQQTTVAAAADIKTGQPADSTDRISPLPDFERNKDKNQEKQKSISKHGGDVNRPAESRIGTLDKLDHTSVTASDESSILSPVKSGFLNTLHTELNRCFHTYPEAFLIGSCQITSNNTISIIHRAQLCFWLCIVIAAASYGPQSLLKLLWYIGVLVMLPWIMTMNTEGGELGSWETIRIPFCQVFCEIPSAVWRDMAFNVGYTAGVLTAGLEAGYNSVELT